MHCCGRQSSSYALRLMKYTELPKHRRAIVINLLTGQPIFLIERVNPAEGKLDPTARSRKPPPVTHVAPPDDDLDDDHVLGDMLSDHINVQIRQSLQQLRVERADLLQAHVVRVPRLIIITSRFPKGRQNAIEIMLVFAANVLRNNLAPRLRRAVRVQAHPFTTIREPSRICN